ncbi:lipid phosphate phosphatase 2-like isoform X1 [Apium graveolens]|uniref:lipid phosphate phosphatase 2-like isoform X1 n=2 Tax=Apium graveolens TaxID=4045 RepID=UPI003D7A1BB2
MSHVLVLIFQTLFKSFPRPIPNLPRHCVHQGILFKMAGGHLGSSPQPRLGQLIKRHLHDWLILLVLGVIIWILNAVEPFHRYLSKEMLTPDIKYPFKEDTVPMFVVPVYALLLPCIIFLMYYISRRDVYDLHYAIIGILFSVLITAVITDAIKDAVGRPRPSFFYRCFPDGKPVFQTNGDVLCTNLAEKVIKEGYKSFPSGHTSWSFAGLGFLGWYLCGKIKVFNGEGYAAKLCIVVLPYLAAALVGISRVDDYWHHWTDVFAGAMIGSTISATCYLQFFPFPHLPNGWAPHASFTRIEDNRCSKDAVDSKVANAVGDLEGGGKTYF